MERGIFNVRTIKYINSTLWYWLCITEHILKFFTLSKSFISNVGHAIGNSNGG